MFDLLSIDERQRLQFISALTSVMSQTKKKNTWMPDEPLCLARVPTPCRHGTCGCPSAQHMAQGGSIMCAVRVGWRKKERNLHCCPCHPDKTQGRVSRQRECFQSLWPFNLPLTSPTILGVGQRAPLCDLGLYQSYYWQGTCSPGSVWLMLPGRKSISRHFLRDAKPTSKRYL